MHPDEINGEFISNNISNNSTEGNSERNLGYKILKELLRLTRSDILKWQTDVHKQYYLVWNHHRFVIDTTNDIKVKQDNNDARYAALATSTDEQLLQFEVIREVEYKMNNLDGLLTSLQQLK